MGRAKTELGEGSEVAALPQAPGSPGKRIRRARRQRAHPLSGVMVGIPREALEGNKAQVGRDL